MVSVSGPRAPGRAGGHILVAHSGRVLLKLPLAATSLVPRPPDAGLSKLSAEAVAELIALAEDSEGVACSSGPNASGTAPPRLCGEIAEDVAALLAEVIHEIGTDHSRHLARRAVIYIRQSTPHQVLTNQESLRLQYDLRRRALDLGWREEDVEVIDSDLGLSGAAAVHRAGFKDLIARVTLGQVGIVLSSEVTRLSRNCTDWYPLLDLCGYRQCLIGDRDGVYDPASANGRLLLGLKGTISEMELHTIRARLTAGLLNKAERGELGLILPVGLVREAAGIVVKNPDREVQARLELVFATFLRLRSAAKVLRSLNEGGLALPRRGRLGGVVWRPPTVAAVLSVLKNPAYAGAFVYGRTRSIREAAPRRPGQRSFPGSSGGSS